MLLRDSLSLHRLSARLLCLTVAAMTLLAFATPARAATYEVDSCQRPDNSNVGIDGWTPVTGGSYVYTASMCGQGGGLEAWFDPSVEHGYTEHAQWRFVSPAGASVVRITAFRRAKVGPQRPYGTPVSVLRSGSSVLENCGSPCAALEGDIDLRPTAADTFSFSIECGGAADTRCPAGDSRISLRRIRVTLNDTSAPALARAPSGTLTSSSDTSRTRALSYSATDAGSGLYRHRLLVDGATVVDQPVDPGSASCSRHALGGFDTPTPCPLTSGGTVELDTASLSDGAHQVRLEVYDATGSNKSTEGPWAITVDNAPPVVGEVDVRGTAREAESLNCAASVDGQSPSISYQWLRANADGSGATEVPGATGAAYTLTGADVGRKLLCRVIGRDGGGSSNRTSTLTGGPFADGALVTSKPAGTTTNPPAGSPGGSGQDGTNGAAGTNGSTSSTSSTTSAASKTSSSSSNTTSGNAGAAATAAAAAVPQCTQSKLTQFGSISSIRRSYGRSRVGLSGRLVGADKRPSVGRVLRIVQTVVRSGNVQRKQIGSVRTQTDGRFRTTAPPGPSRALQLIEEGCGAVGRIITERVRGAVQARTTTRKVRNKQTARIRGRVLGGYVGRGIPVELQVKVGRRWRDVKHAMTDARGQYKVGYRFTRTYVRYTYRFRVVTRAGGAWPFMAAKSRQVKVRVN